MLLPWRDLAPGDGGPVISTSITERETAKLRELARGKVVLEVGTAYGYSAIVMALAGAEVTTVDPHMWLNSEPQFVANAKAYGVADRIRMYRGFSFEALPMLSAKGEKFELVFIDGDHAEEAVRQDALWAWELLLPDGALACHDYGEDTCPGVRAALDKLFGPPQDGELIDTLYVVRP